ncbi:hypothetical protein ERO13_D11G030450v2 [Gossypium hirsutum]|uniref:4Fe-4S ferredoxin-type domain-containing protein n=1 Tax=Gossypium darwinii TaxID=34276 RepID=A0A5D2AIC7_GOSDA|nr:hypothetical protein ERO13_D11G030450v2 [Gossypium hirsutum]TYG43636.1 hypothetical protein ES288_D11G033600v1 [Gossypium darwinii]
MEKASWFKLGSWIILLLISSPNWTPLVSCRDVGVCDCLPCCLPCPCTAPTKVDVVASVDDEGLATCSSQAECANEVMPIGP